MHYWVAAGVCRHCLYLHVVLNIKWLSWLKHFLLSCQLTTLFACFLFFVPATDLLLAWNPVCLGLVEGVIGKIQLHTGNGKWLFIFHKARTFFLEVVNCAVETMKGVTKSVKFLCAEECSGSNDYNDSNTYWFVQSVIVLILGAKNEENQY